MRRARLVRRLLRTLTALGVVLVLAVVLANVVLVGRLERIDAAFAGLTDRPQASPGRTFLLVGTRPGAEGGADVPWLEGEQSVEASMLVHLAPDGLSAAVETLPAGSGAARSATSPRPSGVVESVEAWSGRRVDHLVAIDWTTFEQLAEHSGVDATYAWGAAPAEQRAFLQQVMEGTLHQEMRKRPSDLYRVLSATVRGTAIDDGWSILDMDRLLFELRNLRSSAISYSAARPA
jgi:hypothetical protein